MGLQPWPLPSSLGWLWGPRSLWKGSLDPEAGFNQSWRSRRQRVSRAGLETTRAPCTPPGAARGRGFL